MSSIFCDHRFVVRSYYRRARPGLFRRHVRWCHRCVDCHEYIGPGPIPSKPPRVTWRQKRAQRRWEKQMDAERMVVWLDYKQSGKDLDAYRDELEECWILDLRGEWEPDAEDS